MHNVRAVGRLYSVSEHRGLGGSLLEAPRSCSERWTSSQDDVNFGEGAACSQGLGGRLLLASRISQSATLVLCCMQDRVGIWGQRRSSSVYMLPLQGPGIRNTMGFILLSSQRVLACQRRQGPVTWSLWNWVGGAACFVWPLFGQRKPLWVGVWFLLTSLLMSESSPAFLSLFFLYLTASRLSRGLVPRGPIRAVERGLQSARAQELWCTGLAAAQYSGSSFPPPGLNLSPAQEGGICTSRPPGRPLVSLLSM